MNENYLNYIKNWTRYLVYIQYDGTNFYGFQIQNNKRTVQYEILRSFNTILKKYLKKNKIFENELIKKLINFQYAGRTDSNVHALNNVISFNLPYKFKSEVLKKILNSVFPEDIRVNNVKIVNKEFNPRFEAIKRIYIYILYQGDFLPPFYKKYMYHIREKLDLEVLNKILKFYEGTHNFKAYTTSKEIRNTNRTILNIFALKKENFYIIYISGKSFLHKQIRAIIGASLELYKMFKNGIFKYEEIKKLVKFSFVSGEKTFKFSYMPPHALYLKNVKFKSIQSI